jgi:SOS-response transcriptional repressor LexA
MDHRKGKRELVELQAGRGVKRMTPAQKEVFLVIDEWWKRFGFGPSVDDVMQVLGVTGRGNVSRKMRRLVELGVCKGIKGKVRTIRPSYLRVRDLD